MTATNSAFTATKFKRLDKEECLVDFMKRHKLIEDICPLHSRSIAVVKYLQYTEGITNDKNVNEFSLL